LPKLIITALRKDAGLCCGSRLLEGGSVCLCWAPSKPKGPKGRCFRMTAHRRCGRPAAPSCSRSRAFLKPSETFLGSCACSKDPSRAACVYSRTFQSHPEPHLKETANGRCARTGSTSCSPSKTSSRPSRYHLWLEMRLFQKFGW